jgi:hypothetical protein
MNVAPMIDHRAPIAQAGQALERSRSRADAKIMLVAP